MRRRDFLGVLSGAAATLPLAVSAQQTAMRTIGWLSARSSDTEREARSLAAFREGLAQTGYVEGRNLTIELRFGDGQYDRLPAFAADLVQREVAVLVTTGGSRIAKLAQAATTIIPIVFTTGSDPVEDGLVKSINRPGGNSTGVFLLNNSLAPKRLEVLRELAPNARVVAFLVNPHNLSSGVQVREAQMAANSLDVQLHVFYASSASEIDEAFEALVQRGASALLMGADPIFQVQQDQLVALAARHKVPAIYEWPEFVRAGGLVTYCVDSSEAFRQLGIYVSRILNGAKPAELPIMQTTKFELVVNLKTAKKLGLKIQESFLRFADEVIE
jgi:putative tryptophan/tyrosine transport system substrate-binding protein